MSKDKIILPKTFEDRNGTRPECKGKPKLSYSQYTSYKDPEYQNQYYLQYFLGVELPSGEFAEFGSSCGEYIEDSANNIVQRKGCLSEEDISVLDAIIDYPDGCVYEDEIIVDFGDFVSEGYSDRTWYRNDTDVEIRDYKSLNLDKKADFYASEEYGQTTLYCYQKEREGYTIVNSEVFGLGRKGSSLLGTGNFKMRLSGDYKIIPTPYSKERAEKVIDDMRKVANQISDDYKIFIRYFK